MPRHRAGLPLTAVLLLDGCTDGAVLHDLAVREPEQRERGDYRWIPDGAIADDLARKPARYVGRPRLRLPARERLDDDEPSCPDEVIAEGFPAVSADATAYVFVLEEINSGADWAGDVSVHWRSVASDSELDDAAISNGEALWELQEADPERGCVRSRARIAKAIGPVNDRLASGWRAMQSVPVQLPAPPSWHDDPPEPLANLHERPVDVLYRNGWFLARVQGVRVLQREPKTDWLGLPAEQTMSSTEPTIRGLFHDAATGFALVELSYESASCMSDPTIYTDSITLAPDLVAEAERRAGFVRSWEALEAEQQDAI